MTMSISANSCQWGGHSARWKLIGQPLRPSSSDVEVVSEIVSQFLIEDPHRALRVLMLGVTPEYARFPWPRKTTLIAWDRSESMIRNVWPGSTAETAYVVQGNWMDLTKAVGDFDLILGDGILTQLSYRDEYEELFQRLSMLIRPGGRLVLRLFARSGLPETPEHVLGLVRDGRLTNINQFKLRLGMALCGERDSFEVAVSEIWRVWNQACRRQPELYRRWSHELTSTIDVYQHSSSVYSFPPFDQVHAALQSHLDVTRIYLPYYEYGDSCPTMIMQQ